MASFNVQIPGVITPELLPIILGQMTKALSQLFSGGISIDGNLNVKIVSYTSNVTPDTEDTVAHGLNRVPTGYLVASINKAGVVYKGSTSWTATNIYLKVNVASAAVILVIF